MDKGETNGNRAIVWVREKTAAIMEFYTETRLEMKRVTWPTTKQVRSTTIVVIVTIFFFGAFFAVSDTMVAYVIDLVIRKLARG